MEDLFSKLEFQLHPLSVGNVPDRYKNLKFARIEFENGYGASVLIGSQFYSNGVDTYELAVLYEGEITYNTDITDDVLGHLSKEEVNEILIKIKSL